MESPLKKKKLDHQFQDMSDDNYDDCVKFILSERLSETHGLIDQLGGNKIRTQKVEYEELDPIPTKYEYITSICSNQNSLFIINEKQQCFEYNFTTKSWKLKFQGSDEYYISHFKIDNLGKYVYLRLDDQLCKYEIENDEKELENEIWCFEEFEVTTKFEFFESKNEIYIFEDKSVYIVDALNGSLKKEIQLKTNINDYDYEDCLYLDERQETLFMCFNYNEDDDSDSSDDESEVLKRYCWIGLDKIGKEIKIECNANTEIVRMFSTDLGFATLDKCGLVRVLQGEVFETNENTPFITPLYKYFRTGTYFDKNSNRFYFMDNYNTEVIRVMKINPVSRIENIPLSRESYNSLKRLGAEFPKHVELGKNSSLQFFLKIKFSTGFWYIDEDVQKFFMFRNGPVRDDIDDYTPITKDIYMENRGNHTVSLLVDPSELSSQNVDFSIYVRFQKPNDAKYTLKCCKLSDFLSKLKVCEVIPLKRDASFLISYELVFEELVRKSIIHPETKTIDQTLLAEQYRKCICRREVNPSILLGKCLLVKITETLSNHSTFRIDDLEFLKVDLIALALNFCTEPAILVETIRKN